MQSAFATGMVVENLVYTLKKLNMSSEEELFSLGHSVKVSAGDQCQCTAYAEICVYLAGMWHAFDDYLIEFSFFL